MSEKSSFGEVGDELGIPSQPSADEVPPEVMELVQSGRRLEAVGRYRELTGASLDKAREAISRL